MAETERQAPQGALAQGEDGRQKRQVKGVSTWQDTVAAHPAIILQLIHVLTRALGTKALSFAALLMSFSLFLWAMYKGEWVAYVIATTFALGITWPVLYVGWKPGDNDGKT